MLIDDFEKDAEAFHQELNREYYLAEAGLKDELDIASIYERHAHLFDERVVRDMLRQAQGRQGRYLAEFATLGYLENVVKGLTEKISNAMRQASVEWDEQEVPYPNLRPMIANEPDLVRRHRLDELMREVTASANPERLQRLSDLHNKARQLGFQSYIALCDELRGLDLSWLTQEMESFLDETEDVYFRQLESYLSDMHVPLDRAARCDMLHLLRAPGFDSLFPKGAMIPALTNTLIGMGINVAEQKNLELDTEPRPLKSPRAFCAPILIPGEVKLVIKPTGGPDDYLALLHEAGHAEHFANVDPDLPFAFKRLGDNAVTEGYAFLFQYLPLNRHWLHRILGIEEADDFIQFALFRKLLFVRRYSSKLLYEQELHSELDGAAERYVTLLGDALGVTIAAEDYLDDVDDAFYCAQYLRAWIFEAQLRRSLENRFGAEWFASQDAGQYLISLWRQGQEFTPDELATDLGYDGLDTQYLMEKLVSMPNE